MVQQASDYIHDWSLENHLKLIPTKCREIRKCFKRTPPSFPGVSIEGVEFETVSLAKVLGVTISSDLKSKCQHWSNKFEKIAANLKKSISLKLCSLVGQLVLRIAMLLVSSNIV